MQHISTVTFVTDFGSCCTHASRVHIRTLELSDINSSTAHDGQTRGAPEENNRRCNGKHWEKQRGEMIPVPVCVIFHNYDNYSPQVAPLVWRSYAVDGLMPDSISYFTTVAVAFCTSNLAAFLCRLVQQVMCRSVGPKSLETGNHSRSGYTYHMLLDVAKQVMFIK